MSKDTNLKSSLLDMIEKEVLEQTKDDLKSLYQSNNLQDTKDYRDTKSLVNSALSRHKKSRLVNARQKLNDTKIENMSNASHKLHDAKAKLIELIAKGKMPDGLTMAFHKGGDIPDDEIESIIQDLKDLGIDIDDE